MYALMRKESQADNLPRGELRILPFWIIIQKSGSPQELSEFNFRKASMGYAMIKIAVQPSCLSTGKCVTRLHNAPGDPNRVASSFEGPSCPDMFLFNLESRFSQLSKASQIDT